MNGPSASASRLAAMLVVAVCGWFWVVGTSVAGAQAVPAVWASGSGSSASYRAPVLPVQVLRRFDPPASRYGRGHRGVDLLVGSDGLVRAAGAGTVTFAGAVAGRGVVVIAHADSIRTEYEPVAARVHRGDRVRAGDVIGRLVGVHAGCTGRCLHWSARRGQAYFNPLLLLDALGPVRLLPWA